jgi:hypothetical protein
MGLSRTIGWYAATAAGLRQQQSSSNTIASSLYEQAARTDGFHRYAIRLKSPRTITLMGCDNSSARRNHPELSYEELTEGRWFASAKELSKRTRGS